MLTRGLRVYAGPACPYCQRPFDMETMASGIQHCPACSRRFEAVRFRPLSRRATVQEVGAAGPQEAAACAVHRRNAAVASCQRCGIFMCTLCRTDADGMTLCAACFDRMSAEGTLHSAETRYRDYAGLSWITALGGFVVCFSGVLLGPLSVYYAMRSLRQMNEWGDVGGRGRAVSALVAGVAAFVLGVASVVALMVGP